MKGKKGIFCLGLGDVKFQQKFCIINLVIFGAGRQGGSNETILLPYEKCGIHFFLFWLKLGTENLDDFGLHCTTFDHCYFNRLVLAVLHIQ